MQKLFLIIAAGFALMANVLGAFGAHILKDKINLFHLGIFEKAVHYQFYHSLALFLLAIILFHWQNKFLLLSGVLFILGVTLFSGSLYCLSIFSMSSIGIVTPFGGILFILGWLFLIVGIIKS